MTRTSPTGTPDAFGDPTEQTSIRTFRGWLQQEQRTEDTANADTQSDRWTIYLEPCAAEQIDGSDRITISGQVYELDGPPWAVINPRTAQVSHLEMTARRSK